MSRHLGVGEIPRHPEPRDSGQNDPGSSGDGRERPARWRSLLFYGGDEAWNRAGRQATGALTGAGRRVAGTLTEARRRVTGALMGANRRTETTNVSREAGRQVTGALENIHTGATNVSREAGRRVTRPPLLSIPEVGNLDLGNLDLSTAFAQFIDNHDVKS